MKVLIVDDEETLLETVETKLRREGYVTFTATSAEDGMRLFRLVKPDLILLDIMLPNRSGHDLCRAIRKASTIPIIFVSARAAEMDRVTGLELGADDYIVKPFSLAELSARVKTVLQRSGPSDSIGQAVDLGWLKIDPKAHVASTLHAGQTKDLALSPKEFGILYFLASNPGQVFSREVLLDRIWGQDAYVSSRTVDVHIRWIREQIERDSSSPEHIMTVRGIGYKFIV